MSNKVFDCEQCNALYQALHDCSSDHQESIGNPKPEDKNRYDVYEYLQSTARTSLVAELVMKLKENGFKIDKK